MKSNVRNRFRILKSWIVIIAALVGVGIIVGIVSVFGTENPSETTASGDKNIDLTPGNLPIVKDFSIAKKMTVAISIPAQQVTKSDAVPQHIRMSKETGVYFEWLEIPENGKTEKVNLILAGKELPDAFWDLITNEMIVQYMGQDVLMPLEKLEATYMPQLTHIFAQRPQYQALTLASDGHTYGFPCIEEMYGLELTPGPFLINKTWLDKVGKAVPTTVDQWVDCLKAFKAAGDLNGNGKADEIPFAFGFGAQDTFGSMDTFYQFPGCFGQAITCGGNRPEDYLGISKDNKVVFNAKNESFKKTSTFFNELNKAGLIDIDSFSPHATKSSALYIDKVKAADAVIGSFGVWAPLSTIPNQKVRDQYVPLPRLAGANGKMGNALNFSEMQNLARFAISSTCKQPEVLARFIDYMYQPKISVTADWGALDYVLFKKDNGVLGYKFDNGVPVLTGGWTSIGEMAYNTRGTKGALCVLNDYYDKVVEYAWDTRDLLAFQKVNGKEEILKETVTVPRMLLTVAEQSVVSQIQPQIRNVVDSYRMKWILDGNAEATWSKYLSDLDGAGLQKMLDAYQSAYDRYLKNVK